MIFSFVTRQTIYRFATCIFLYNGQAHYFSLCMQIVAQACQTSSIQRFRKQYFTLNSSFRFSVTLLASQIAYLAFLKAIMSNNPLSQRQNNNFLFKMAKRFRYLLVLYPLLRKATKISLFYIPQIPVGLADSFSKETSFR